MRDSDPVIDPAAIAAIHARILPYVRETPVLQVQPAEYGLACASLSFKLEFLQHTGSFKVRGAFASLLTRKVPAEGVVAASGGNHGAAVAYAAQVLGVPATIFVPAIASPAKLARIQSYGARLVVGGERYADALAASEAYRVTHGGMAIHAFDDVETILGQGSVARELEAQVPQLDTLLVAVGGGGLIGGIAAWYGSRVKVVSVEPALAPTLFSALAAGAPVEAAAGGIAADSLAPRQVGAVMFPIARAHVAQAVLVPDAAIATAQRMLWEGCRIVVEPGGAAALAALLTGGYVPAAGERVGVLLCGANTNAVTLP